MPLTLSENQKILIEKYGVLMERFGLSPVSARVNALLTVTNLPYLSFDEIRVSLNISKSATSTAINTLLLLDYITFKTELGDRKRYFYPSIESWKVKLERYFLNLKELSEVLEEIAESKTNQDLEQKKDVIEYSNFLHDLALNSIQSLELEKFSDK